MKDENDFRAMKAARSLLQRKGIDISLADVRVMKGRCTIRGIVQPMKGFEQMEMAKELEQIALLLRQKPEIREVSVECQIGRSTA